MLDVAQEWSNRSHTGDDTLLTVTDHVLTILRDIPPGITVVAAAKGTRVELVEEALAAGIHIVGHNYIAEARRMRSQLAMESQWHFIGRLRTHDVRVSTLRLFDMIQTVDSLRLAERIDAVCATAAMQMDVLVEVNSGREPQKAGVLPEQAETLLRDMAHLPHIHVQGLMTMGPLGTSSEEYRPCLAETHALFEHIKQLAIPGIAMRHLSMGMSDSYQVAIQEGATMVRLGTLLFGQRQPSVL